MHDAIKTVIVIANSELQGVVVPEEAITESAPEPPTVPAASLDREEIPAAPTAFDVCDENGIFSLAVDNFEYTGIRQGSNAPVDVVHPSTVRSDVVQAVLADPVNSHRVARTFELRSKMKELPYEVRMRVDQRLDEFFGSSLHATEQASPLMSLSEKEEHIIAYNRILQLVVGRMQIHYEAGQINQEMFHVLCKLISKNFTAHTYDPSEETVANTVDGFFSGSRYIGQFADISSHFIQ